MFSEPLKDELDQIQKQQVIVPMCVNETSEWCNSFVLVWKANGKLQLCLLGSHFSGQTKFPDFSLIPRDFSLIF